MSRSAEKRAGDARIRPKQALTAAARCNPWLGSHDFIDDKTFLVEFAGLGSLSEASANRTKPEK